MLIKKNEKYLFVTRGIPGAGKSYFIKTTFTDEACIISPDELRIQRNGIIQTKDNGPQISQENAAEIWKTVFEKLNESTSKNQITVLDATSIRNKQLKKYKYIAEKNKATFVIIDFTHLELSECLYRNANRLPVYKRVPEEVIKKMYDRINIPLSPTLENHIIKSTDFVLQYENTLL